MYTYSEEHNRFIKKEKRFKSLVHLSQILIIILLFSLWQILANIDIINTFLYSSPLLILKTIINLIKQGILFNHIVITLYEVIISILISSLISLIIAINTYVECDLGIKYRIKNNDNYYWIMSEKVD